MNFNENMTLSFLSNFQLQEAEYFVEQQRMFQMAQRPSPNKYEKGIR
jgi:hypothetical protein